MKLSTLILLAASGSIVLSAPAPIVKTVEVQSTQIVTASPTVAANQESNSKSTGTPGRSQAGSASSNSQGWLKWSSLFSQLLGMSSDNDNSGSQDSIHTVLDLSATRKAQTKTQQTQAAAATSTGKDDIFGWLFRGSTTTLSTAALPTSSSESSSISSSSQTVPSSKTSSSTSSPSGSSDGDIYAGIYQSPGVDKQFAKDTLDAHNKYRREHNVGDLSWDVDAYNYAKNVADKYDCSGVLTHTHGPYGENLASGYSSGPAAVKAWYDEGKSYDYSSANTYNHFTQVVWKSTTKVGCAYKNCQWNNWGLYVICSYSPAGNMIGQESQNVLPEN